MNWFGKKETKEIIPKPKEKTWEEIRDDGIKSFPLLTHEGDITTKEVLLIIDYLRYFNDRLINGDNNIGYKTGMSNYLIKRLEMTIHKFSPTGFITEKEMSNVV